MENNKLIHEIRRLFKDNIDTIDDIKIRHENESLLYCLFIGDKIASVDIQRSFIKGKSIKEIEKYFMEKDVYKSIFYKGMCDHEGVFVTPNSVLCREMFPQ